MNKAQKLAQACNIRGFFLVIRGTCPAVHLLVEPILSPPTFLSLLPLLLLRLGTQSYQAHGSLDSVRHLKISPLRWHTIYTH